MTTSNSSTDPLFITGTQRSGTTLLYQILGGSSFYWCRNEVGPVNGMLFGKPRCSLPELYEKLQWLGMSDGTDVCGEQGLSDPVECFDRCLAQNASANGKPQWCLKDPEIAAYLEQYANHWPTAKFLLMIRDPRAVARSYLERGTSCNWFAAAERWQREVQQQLDFHRRNTHRTLLVKYEDVIDHFEDQMERICSFLGIPVEQSLIHYYQRKPETEVHEGNLNICRPPDHAIVEKWRESITPRAKALVEYVAGPLMEELGYRRESEGYSPSRSMKALYRVHNSLVWEWRWQRSSNWFGIRKRVAALFGKKATFDLSQTMGKFR